MIVIVALDDNNGMMFNSRRQSRDKYMLKDVLNTCGERKLWMNEYTSNLFEELSDNMIVDEAFLDKAKEGDYCFVENKSIMPYMETVEKIIIYRWNKIYPSDFKFDDKLIEGWVRESIAVFDGNSHDAIGKEEWINE